MKYIAPRDMTVASISGRSVTFAKGEPTFAPPQMHAELIARGIVPAEDIPELAPDESTEPTGAIDRQAAIASAIEKIVLRNARGDFSGTGAPHASVLAKELGWSGLDVKERDASWVSFQAAEADKVSLPAAPAESVSVDQPGAVPATRRTKAK